MGDRGIFVTGATQLVQPQVLSIRGTQESKVGLTALYVGQ